MRHYIENFCEMEGYYIVKDAVLIHLFAFIHKQVLSLPSAVLGEMQQVCIKLGFLSSFKILVSVGVNLPGIRTGHTDVLMAFAHSFRVTGRTSLPPVNSMGGGILVSLIITR